MDTACSVCHDTLDLVEWTHPGTGEAVTLCQFCMKSVIGTCHECDDIIMNVDRYGVDEKGNKICSACAARNEIEDERRADGGG